MSDSNIVVVGGGFGGIYTVKNLAKKFKKNSGVKITLIDKNSYMTYMTELYEVAADRSRGCRCHSIRFAKTVLS